MLRYYAQTMPGVEKIAWLEIRHRLPQAVFGDYLFAKDQNGVVLFDYGGSPADLLALRTTEDIFLLAISESGLWRGRRELARITDLVARSEPFGRAANQLTRFRQFSRPPTYRVISRLYGRHPFRRRDLAQAVAQGLQRRYPRWTPVAEGGQVEVWANLLGRRLLIGLRLSDREMRHRFRRQVELPASLRPSVAAAMVWLTEPDPADVFLDPMCGSGTLLLERRAAGACQALLAGDVDGLRAEAARANLSGRRRRAGREPAPTVACWDAAHLPLPAAAVDKIAVNLPFGRQVSADLSRLYPAFFAEATRVIRPGGRAVILSSEYDLVKSCVRRQPALQILTGYSVAVLGRWGRIYIVTRR